MNYYKFVAIIFVIAIWTSCKKDSSNSNGSTPPKPSTTAKVTVFTNGNDLRLAEFKTDSGRKYTFFGTRDAVGKPLKLTGYSLANIQDSTKSDFAVLDNQGRYSDFSLSSGITIHVNYEIADSIQFVIQTPDNRTQVITNPFSNKSTSIRKGPISLGSGSSIVLGKNNNVNVKINKENALTGAVSDANPDDLAGTYVVVKLIGSKGQRKLFMIRDYDKATNLFSFPLENAGYDFGRQGALTEYFESIQKGLAVACLSPDNDASLAILKDEFFFLLDAAVCASTSASGPAACAAIGVLTVNCFSSDLLDVFKEISNNVSPLLPNIDSEFIPLDSSATVFVYGESKYGVANSLNSLSVSQILSNASPYDFLLTFKFSTIDTVIKKTAILSVLSGNNQTGPNSRALTSPILVRVLDNNSHPVPHVALTWSTTNGVIVNSSSVTDSTGQGSAYWTLGPSLGLQTLTVIAVSPDGNNVVGSPAIVNATSTVSNVFSLSLLSGNNQSGPINKPLTNPLVVRVLNNGKPAGGIDLVWTAPAGILNGALKTDADGRATATWTLGNNSGAQSGSVKASVPNGESVSGSPISLTANAIKFISPTVTTSKPNAITETSILSGGNFSNIGGYAILATGVCWNIGGNPTVQDARTNDGIAEGIYRSSVSGLSLNISYHIRAYVIDAYDTTYGNDITFQTIPAPIISGLFNLVSWRFGAPIPGNVNVGFANDVNYNYIGLYTVLFANNNYTWTAYDSAGTGIVAQSSGAVTVGAYYSDSLFFPEPGSDATNSYGHQYPEGWGLKLPPGFEIDNFSNGYPARLSRDGTYFYPIQQGDMIYKKK